MKTARSFAIQKHGSQKYGTYPYVYHLDLVHDYLISFGYDTAAYREAAYLHDTLEDTDTTLVELINLFGDNVASMVYAVTGIGKTRDLRTKDTIEKLKVFPDAIPLKMADRLVNMRFSSENSPRHLEMYAKELQLYSSLFKKTNKKMYGDMLQLSKTIKVTSS